MEALINALKILGITGQITTKQHDEWTLDIYIDDKWFGLWDTTKNTFVE